MPRSIPTPAASRYPILTIKSVNQSVAPIEVRE